MKSKYQSLLGQFNLEERRYSERVTGGSDEEGGGGEEIRGGAGARKKMRKLLWKTYWRDIDGDKMPRMKNSWRKRHDFRRRRIRIHKEKTKSYI